MIQKFFAFAVFLFLQISLQAQNNGVRNNNRDTAKDEIIFLMLRVAKDSSSGDAAISVIEKVNRPGRLKSSRNFSGMMRLPYLSFVFYRGSMAVDSFRQSYPLRERIQNTRNNIQGYQDTEVDAREIFLRFQKPDADKLKIYLVTATDTQEALTVEL